MEQPYISEALIELSRIFHLLNDKYFEGKLQDPVLTIQSTKKKILGWCTLKKVWKPTIKETTIETSKLKSRYEINICAQHLVSPPELLAETVLHEMIHLSNIMNDISDCTNAYYHNKRFKKAAEKIGLICEKDKKYGYGLTSLSEDLKKYIIEEIKVNADVFKYFREIELTKSSGGSDTRKKRIFKYTCPKCGLEAKGKLNIHVVCKSCNEELKMEEES